VFFSAGFNGLIGIESVQEQEKYPNRLGIEQKQAQAHSQQMPLVSS
jgi:hypothetical protein